MIALIAHDQKKPSLLQLVGRHLNFFRQHKLIATGSTGTLIQQEFGLEVECVAHGPHGGDLVIGGRLVIGEIEAVIFFRDPLTAQPHEPDVTALLRVCDVHDIPLATNHASAEAILCYLSAAR